MQKVKVIRGRPVYVYKGSNYLDKPDKTIVKKMLYKEEDSITYVYCRKPGVKIELICSIILVLCVLYNVLYLHDAEVTIRYNSVSTYYNDSLYLNLVNDEKSPVSVSYELLDEDTVIYEGVLNPGDVIISIPIDDIKENYTLHVEYSTLISDHEDTMNVSVLDRSVK